MSEDKCKCDFRTKLVGDGCRYCNAQEYIDKLSGDYNDLLDENEQLEDRLASNIDELKRYADALGEARQENLKLKAELGLIPTDKTIEVLFEYSEEYSNKWKVSSTVNSGMKPNLRLTFDKSGNNLTGVEIL